MNPGLARGAAVVVLGRVERHRGVGGVVRQVPGGDPRGRHVAASQLVAETAGDDGTVPRQDAFALHGAAPEARLGRAPVARQRAERRGTVVLEVEEVPHDLATAVAPLEHRVGLDGRVTQHGRWPGDQLWTPSTQQIGGVERHPAMRREAPGVRGRRRGERTPTSASAVRTAAPPLTTATATRRAPASGERSRPSEARHRPRPTARRRQRTASAAATSAAGRS